MDLLFSPWRAEHVARAADDARAAGHADGPPVFTEIAAAPDRDRENLVVYRGAHVFAVLNRYPYTNGHLLVLPLREVATLDALDAGEQAALIGTAARATRWLRAALAPDGFNVGLNEGSAAGAAIPRHLHLHVVPRWHGDTNFLPVVGATKVIPEALDATWAKLRAAVEADDETEGR